MLRVSIALASLLLLVPSYAVSLDTEKELVAQYKQQIEQIELTNSPYEIVE